MKRVSFKTSKTLKEAGYPQDMIGGYYSEICKPEARFQYAYINVVDTMYAAPIYLEVWLWLWREKEIFITFDNHITFISSLNGLDIELPDLYSDPEEAIIAAIEYLVDNDLIK